MKQNEPFWIGEKEIALTAAINAGLVPKSSWEWDITKFEDFWLGYQSGLAAHRLKKCNYLAEMLQKEREERAKDCANYRRKYLGIAISMIFGTFFGAVVTKLFLHL